MSSGRWIRARRVAVLLAVLPFLAAATGCGPPDRGPEDRDPAAATPVPATPDDLEPLVVDEVPSGLPRLPDAGIGRTCLPAELSWAAVRASSATWSRFMLSMPVTVPSPRTCGWYINSISPLRTARPSSRSSCRRLPTSAR